MKEIKLRVSENRSKEFDAELQALLEKHGAQRCLVRADGPITERVKTFEDACDELNARCEQDGNNHPLVAAYEQIMNLWDAYDEVEKNDTMLNTQKHLIAYMKLSIITAALNEGWVPTFANDEYRWFPWFRYYTKEEIEGMSEKEKQKLGLVGAHAISGSQSGLAYDNSDNGWADAYTDIGSRLAYKTKELADYSGKQFKEIWADYVGKFPKVDNFEEYEKAFGTGE